MELFVVGGDRVTLERKHFVAAGGQGAVYARDGYAYKVFSDPASILPDAKLRELSVLPEPRFNRPQALLVDAGGAVVGYVTRYVVDALVLCQLFPRAFRERERFTHAHALLLIEQLRDGVSQAHAHNITLVDLNEMNFLVSRDFQKLTFIDTDSYQTRGFPARAIMDSVRDRHMPDPAAFDHRSDWFSFACVSFQLFTGIHPYKGKHPALKGLNARMLANVSVLNKDVKVPSSVYGFDVIPPLWRHWYADVLEHGRREPPPAGRGGVAQVPAIPLRPARPRRHNAPLVVATRAVFPGRIQNVWSQGPHLVVATDQGLWIDERQVVDWPDTQAVLGGSARTVAIRANTAGTAELRSLDDDTPVTAMSELRHVVSHEGRTYNKSGDQIVELQLQDWGRPVVSTRTAVHVLPHATRLFPGVVIQNLLGSCFVSLLLKDQRTPQIRLPELDGCRIIDAKWACASTGGVLMVAVMHDDAAEHVAFRFSPDFDRYDVQRHPDAGPAGINFIVTAAGICVQLSDDGELLLRHASIGRDGQKIVADDSLTGDMRLHQHNGEVLASNYNQLLRLAM